MGCLLYLLVRHSPETRTFLSPALSLRKILARLPLKVGRPQSGQELLFMVDLRRPLTLLGFRLRLATTDSRLPFKEQFVPIRMNDFIFARAPRRSLAP